METARPICPPSVGVKGIVIDACDNNIGRRELRREKLVRQPQIDTIEWLDQKSHKDKQAAHPYQYQSMIKALALVSGSFAPG
jgi:hypothetical protein